MFQNFIIPKLSNIGLANHRLPVETGRWGDIPLNERKCKICTTDDIGDEYHYLFTRDILRVTEKYFIIVFHMLSQIHARKGSVLPQPMRQRLLNYQHLLQVRVLGKIFSVYFFSK